MRKISPVDAPTATTVPRMVAPVATKPSTLWPAKRTIASSAAQLARGASIRIRSALPAASNFCCTAARRRMPPRRKGTARCRMPLGADRQRGASQLAQNLISRCVARSPFRPAATFRRRFFPTAPSGSSPRTLPRAPWRSLTGPGAASLIRFSPFMGNGLQPSQRTHQPLPTRLACCSGAMDKVQAH